MQAPDEGIEFGFEKGSWTTQLALSNGTAGAPEVDDGKQIVARTEYVGSAWRMGASAAFNDTDVGDRMGAGLFGAFRVGAVTLLGEVDYFDDDSIGAAGRKLMASLVEADWKVLQGHNVKLTFEWLEPDTDVDEDEQTRTSLLYEWSPIQFIQLRAVFACTTAFRRTICRTGPRRSCSCMASSRPLEDAPDRSYAPKLERFSRFIQPELKRLFGELAIEPGARVLDVGCGVGFATRLFAGLLGNEAQVVGVDLSLPHLRAARADSSPSWVQADAAQLCFSRRDLRSHLELQHSQPPCRSCGRAAPTARSVAC
jgi:hypothetical protein